MPLASRIAATQSRPEVFAPVAARSPLTVAEGDDVALGVGEVGVGVAVGEVAVGVGVGEVGVGVGVAVDAASMTTV